MCGAAFLLLLLLQSRLIVRITLGPADDDVCCDDFPSSARGVSPNSSPPADSHPPALLRTDNVGANVGMRLQQLPNVGPTVPRLLGTNSPLFTKRASIQMEARLFCGWCVDVESPHVAFTGCWAKRCWRVAPMKASTAHNAPDAHLRPNRTSGGSEPGSNSAHPGSQRSALTRYTTAPRTSFMKISVISVTSHWQICQWWALIATLINMRVIWRRWTPNCSFGERNPLPPPDSAP